MLCCDAYRDRSDNIPPNLDHRTIGNAGRAGDGDEGQWRIAAAPIDAAPGDRRFVGHWEFGPRVTISAPTTAATRGKGQVGNGDEEANEIQHAGA
jgi:hypothetical protein